MLDTPQYEFCVIYKILHAAMAFLSNLEIGSGGMCVSGDGKDEVLLESSCVEPHVAFRILGLQLHNIFSGLIFNV